MARSIERSPVSRKSLQFTESVIREMTRLAMEHDAVNLAQGFPDFPAPAEVKEAAVRAIRADVDPEREVTVCCGALRPELPRSSPWSIPAKR